jgi:hypothetical protein
MIKISAHVKHGDAEMHYCLFFPKNMEKPYAKKCFFGCAKFRFMEILTFLLKRNIVQKILLICFGR